MTTGGLNGMEIHTQRLLMRQWRAEDYSLFARMNGCPQVMQYFPNVMSSQQSDQLADNISQFIRQNGWGLWALEEKASGGFIGFTGLHPVAEDLPFHPATEIGWRLDRHYWGRGYATEAALAALAYAFDVLKRKQVVSFTARTNQPSINVMRRVGMFDTGNTFYHPRVAADSPFSEHVLYRIDAEQWTPSLRR